eukprot:2692726-Amphidinium_carterae.1
MTDEHCPKVVQLKANGAQHKLSELAIPLLHASPTTCVTQPVQAAINMRSRLLSNTIPAIAHNQIKTNAKTAL